MSKRFRPLSRWIGLYQTMENYIIELKNGVSVPSRGG